MTPFQSDRKFRNDLCTMVRRGGFLFSVFVVLTGSALSQATEIGRQVFVPEAKIKPRPTHDDLAKKQPASQKGGEAEQRGKPIKRKDLKGGSTKKSLIARSAMISFGKHWTIVPKEAILYVPAHLQARVNGPRRGTLLTWPQFYMKNRGWLRVQNVNLAQARGEIGLGEDAVERFKNSAQVVVAVCQNGPISVKPLQEESSEEVENAKTSKK